MNDDELIHLLANPFHMVRKKKIFEEEITTDDRILQLLQNKYPKLGIHKEDYDHLIPKIENLIINTIIQNIVSKIIHSIDE